VFSCVSPGSQVDMHGMCRRGKRVEYEIRKGGGITDLRSAPSKGRF